MLTFYNVDYLGAVERELVHFKLVFSESQANRYPWYNFNFCFGLSWLQNLSDGFINAETTLLWSHMTNPMGCLC